VYVCVCANILIFLSHSFHLCKVPMRFEGSILQAYSCSGIFFVIHNCSISFGFLAVLEHLHTLSVKSFNHSFHIYWTNINWIPETVIHVSIKQWAILPPCWVRTEEQNWRLKGRLASGSRCHWNCALVRMQPLTLVCLGLSC
jgi:hypothetical protein